MRRCSPSSPPAAGAAAAFAAALAGSAASTLAVFTAVSAAFAASGALLRHWHGGGRHCCRRGGLGLRLNGLHLCGWKLRGLDLRDLRSRLGDSSSLGGCSRRGLSTLHELHAGLANGGACGFGRGGGGLGGDSGHSGLHLERRPSSRHPPHCRPGSRAASRAPVRGGKAIRSADGLLGHPIAVR